MSPNFKAGAREGFRVCLPVSVGLIPWALVTGLAMVSAGFTPVQAMGMSFIVFGATAQLGTLPLIVIGAPWWLILATALVVNLRFVIFSAAWRPYFVGYPLGQRLRLAYLTADLNYVQFMRRFPHPQPHADQVPYFWGGVSLNWTSWQALSVAGIYLNRKNLIVLLMAIELMLLAVNTNFVAFSHYLGDMQGQVFVFFILTVAAAESAIGLAILVLLFRNRSSINVEELNSLKG